MADVGVTDGWHLVVAHPATEIREEKQIEQWERSAGQWSGYGKHPNQWADHKNVRVHDRELGVGSYGVVERITYRTVTMARKHVKPRRGITVEKLREEANAMERLAHKHILKLVGTYTLKRNDLYLLLYPAAVCDLSKVLEDIDDIRSGTVADHEDALGRLNALGLRDVGTIGDLAILRKVPTAESSPGIATAIGFLQQTLGCITEALAYVHEKGIRHRDLKPKNILVSPGRVYLADFGIARDVRDSEDSITRGRSGTPSWTAPEVHDDQDHHMSPADVWSLGCIFLNIATVMYGQTLEQYDRIMKERDPKLKYELLPEYLEDLRTNAIAASLENQDKPNFNCKHIMDLIDHMLKYKAEERPLAREVNDRLLELGGLDQIYHLSCCHKQNTHICKVINNKMQSVFNNNIASAVRLAEMQAEIEQKQKRIERLESISRTWEQRIDKERKHAGEQYKALQEKYNREVEARKQLESQLQSQQKPLRRPKLQSRGRGRGLGLLQFRNDVASLQPRSVDNHTPPHSMDSRPDFGPPQRRPSRVPLPVRPSTPLRPILSREPASTSSTLLSSAYSTFSRVSIGSNDSASSVSSDTVRSTSPDSPTAGGARLPVTSIALLSPPPLVKQQTDSALMKAVNVSKPSWANMVARPPPKV